MPEQFCRLYTEIGYQQKEETGSPPGIDQIFPDTARESAYAGLFVQNSKTHMSSW